MARTTASKYQKQDLWDVFNLETELFPCLVDMKFKGVRVDLDVAHSIKDNLVKTEKRITTGHN